MYSTSHPSSRGHAILLDVALDLLPRLLLGRLHLRLLFICSGVPVSHQTLHDMALAPACRLARILTLLNLSNHQLKRFLHVLVVSRAGLGPTAVELGLKSLALLGRDLALFRSQVGLVPYDDERDILGGLEETCVSCLEPRETAASSRTIQMDWSRLCRRGECD